jgi:serine/threonine protein kinase
MLDPGTILQNRYHITRQLGQGGMGAVYEAIDERLHVSIALKETLFTEERLRRQFEREALLLAKLHHPAIPKVSDHFNEGGGQFLVMQFIPGSDLWDMLLQKGAAFSIDEVIRWGDQLLDVLDYLHTHEPPIVHRDIKPQNLKLTSRGQIILLDFGLAKGFAGQTSRVVTSGSVFGYTPNYAPLEQIHGTGTDPRSDLFALGATLYHLITNIKPADVLTRMAATADGQPDPLRPAHEINEQVSPSVSAVLNKAMAIGRNQRFSTASEMRQALTYAVKTRAENLPATILDNPPARSAESDEFSTLHMQEQAGEAPATDYHRSKYLKAEAECKQAIELEPDNPMWRVRLLDALSGQNKDKEVQSEAEALERIARGRLRSDPENADYHYSLGTALDFQKRHHEAIVWHQEAIRLNPKNADYHARLGHNLESLKKYQEAKAEYREAVRLKPNDAQYHISLGDFLLRKKEYRGAEAEYRAAVRLNPDDAMAHNGLGESLEKQQRYKEAEIEFTEARRLYEK